LYGPSQSGNSAFCEAGPKAWKNLLTGRRQPDMSYSRFRQSLKTKVQCESVFNCALEILLRT